MTPTIMPLYPLLTERRVMEPIWGGTRLARWLALPPPHPERIGETWQVYDTNPVRNGALAGRSLSELSRDYGVELLGTRPFARYGADFPLLAKFIDAAQPLSIQVHPDDAYAHAYEVATGFHGKTEAWYILAAAPGATVLYGLTRESDRSAFRAAVESGNIEGLFHRLPVQAGDVVFVPAGTLHAIDAGITLFEIQQKSDLTYRVYDYGRTDARTGQPRELHLDKALDVSTLAPAPRGTVPPLPLDERRTLLVACPFFALERWRVDSPMGGTTDSGSFEIFTSIEGNAVLSWKGGSLDLPLGDSVVLPASLGAYTFTPGMAPNGSAPLLLRAHVPDIEQNYFQPLTTPGMSQDRIAQTVIR